MHQLLSDPALAFAVAVVGVGVAIVGVVIAYLSRRLPKRLTYDVLSATPLSSFEGAITAGAARLESTFAGKVVEEGFVIDCMLTNSGSAPIEHQDYEDAIFLRFGDRAHVLSWATAELKPTNLHPHLNAAQGKLRLDPLLLNPGDMIKLKVLVERYEGHLQVEGRIAGVAQIRREAQALPKKRRRANFIKINAVTCVASLLAAIYGFHSADIGMMLAGGTIGTVTLSNLLEMVLPQRGPTPQT